MAVLETNCAKTSDLEPKWFRVAAMTNPKVTNVVTETEVDVELAIRPAKDARDKERSTQFTVSPFDFPMIENVRLDDRSRVSVLMTRVDDGGVTLALAYFPAARASLKDKPFHDEVLNTLSGPMRR